MARLHPVFPDSASIMAKKLSTSQASPIMITVQISANHQGRTTNTSGYDRLAYVHQDCYVVAVDLRRRGLISARRRGLKDKGIFEFFPQFPPDVGGHPLALHERMMRTIPTKKTPCGSEHAGARRLPGGGRSSCRGHPLQRMTPCVPACAATALLWRNR